MESGCLISYSTWCKYRLKEALVRAKVSEIFLDKLVFNNQASIIDIINVFDSQSIDKLTDYIRRYKLELSVEYHLFQYLTDFINLMDNNLDSLVLISNIH